MCFISGSRKKELLAKEAENDSLKAKIKMINEDYSKLVSSAECIRKDNIHYRDENNALKEKLAEAEAKLSLLKATPKTTAKATTTGTKKPTAAKATKKSTTDNK